jgi:hypothetical protein
MSLNPYVFGSLWGYKTCTWLLLAVLFLVFRYFGKTFFSLPGIWKVWPGLFLLTILVSSDSITEGFYYMGGALFYQPGNVLWLFLLSSLLKNPPLKEGLNYRVGETFVLALQGAGFFLLAGCNEVGMVMGLALTGFLVASQMFFWRRFSWGLFFLFLSASAGAFVVLASPATFYRMEASNSFDRSFSWVLIQSVQAAIGQIFEWFSKPAFLLFLLISVFLPVSERVPLFSRKYCLGLSILALGSFVLAFAPAFKGEGLLQARTSNALQFLFLSLALVLIAFWKRSLSPLPALNQKLLAGMMLLFWGISIFSGNSLLVWKDLISNEAKAYSQERDQRETWMKTAKGDSVWVSPVSHRPKSLFHGDLGDYPDPWYDNHYAGMFGKESVLLADSLHPPGYSK